MEEKRVTVRLPIDMYDMVIGRGSVSEVIREALSYYFTNFVVKQQNVGGILSTMSVGKNEHGEKPHKQLIKNALYYSRLRRYKEIINTPGDDVYVEGEGDMPKGEVLAKLGLSKDLFDENDIC